jgi:dTDP-4-amino-4,6-dideoxygalactose transaminase
MSDPFKVVRDFEDALCEYTGAKYAVTVTSCTMALFLVLGWFRAISSRRFVEIPKHTYVGVAQSILSAGFKIEFNDDDWRGQYMLRPFPIWDCARRFTFDMYVPDCYQCVSFHPTKILGLSTYGGAILHNHDGANQILRSMRFDGRQEGVPPKDDSFVRGWHCYMSPVTAAEGLMRLSTLPKHNEDLPNDDYPDLSKQEIFR